MTVLPCEDMSYRSYQIEPQSLLPKSFCVSKQSPSYNGLGGCHTAYLITTVAFIIEVYAKTISRTVPWTMVYGFASVHIVRVYAFYACNRASHGTRVAVLLESRKEWTAWFVVICCIPVFRRYFFLKFYPVRPCRAIRLDSLDRNQFQNLFVPSYAVLCCSLDNS